MDKIKGLFGQMRALVSILYDCERYAKVSWVDARTLHNELGVGKVFGAWMVSRIEKYEFAEGDDYKLTLSKIGKRKNVTQKDYSLTLDMAKELSMVENNRIGGLIEL